MLYQHPALPAWRAGRIYHPSPRDTAGNWGRIQGLGTEVTTSIDDIKTAEGFKNRAFTMTDLEAFTQRTDIANKLGVMMAVIWAK